MIGHDLEREQRNLVTLQPFGQDALECFEVFVLVENGPSGIAANQRVIQSIGFIRSRSTRHERTVSATPKNVNEC